MARGKLVAVVKAYVYKNKSSRIYTVEIPFDDVIVAEARLDPEDKIKTKKKKRR